jgi:hypothetical protein
MDPIEKEIKVLPTNIKLDILLLTTTAQNQNGVKVNDFLRYSNYCKTKINK